MNPLPGNPASAGFRRREESVWNILMVDYIADNRQMEDTGYWSAAAMKRITSSGGRGRANRKP